MKNKDAAVRFMRAYNKACNYYYEAAVEKKDAKKLEEVVNIVAKYVKAPAEDIKAGLPYIDKDGKLLVSDIAIQIKWYTDNKMISGTLDAKDVANTSFLDEAMKK